MSRRLDDLSRALAHEEGTVGRRRFLGKVLAVIGGTAAGVGLGEGTAGAITCPPGFAECGGVCRDINIDPDNCGTCGNVCPSGKSCRNGACVDCVCGTTSSCPPGQTLCSGVCVNLMTNTKNCGTCGHKCAKNQTCQSGICHSSTAQCTTPSDCPGVDNECGQRTCVNNVCGMTFVASGTPVGVQVAGDCQKNACDGAGHTISMPDDTDIQDDGNECTTDLCQNGIPSHAPAAQGTVCSTGVCDGQGKCVSVCGDGVAGPGEVCDGNDLNGETCQSLGFSGGVLACSPGCGSFDTSGCVP